MAENSDTTFASANAPRNSTRMREEEWRAIGGYEGLYEVSSYGRVRSLDRTVALRDASGVVYQRRSYKGQILKHQPHEFLYPQVKLSKHGRIANRYVHTLVCEAFHGPRPYGYDVAHGDGDPTNPHVDNLRWATRSENIQDAIGHGTFGGVRNWNARLNPEKVREIRAAHAAGVPQVALSAKYGVKPVAIHDVLRRRTWASVV